MMQEIKTSMSHSGRKQYRKHWESFRTFAKQLNVRSLPASTHTVGLYITHLRHMDHRPALKCSTIRTHLSAIASHHMLQGKKDPTKKFLNQQTSDQFCQEKPPSQHQERHFSQTTAQPHHHCEKYMCTQRLYHLSSRLFATVSRSVPKQWNLLQWQQHSCFTVYWHTNCGNQREERVKDHTPLS